MFVSLNPSFDNAPFDAGNLFAYLEESKSVPEPTTTAGLLIFSALGAAFSRQKK
ncbi:PEP-CTERM sorting domain-containing protein [Lyngbya sp. PCC 8106]|uniref:PEP-CTERM sorting domain-containing protein n=1 Tax=Lyngbya sp. (strain PCC 8106) TaxID=313612 RepID=UPI0000EAB71C|nr:PEP-CTERM sorting domain-containing protein [Lyngbya sp. PCC 8106]EAW33702.1 Inosine/uridine-preferring nucleoside hydrolase [Lyngbya sp. PCC 8106]